MNKVARLPATERLDLFQETATQRGVSAAVIEKDFWVCWVLKQLFADAALGTRLTPPSRFRKYSTTLRARSS